MASEFSYLERVFRALAAQSSPALIWYSAAGERVELSGRVLENWISKSANFLVEECEFVAGEVLQLRMGLHWRSLLLAATALRVGAVLDLAGQRAEAGLVFSDQLGILSASTADYAVAVDRAVFSTGFTEKLGADMLDYCALVSSYADQYTALELPDSAGQVFADRDLNYGDLPELVEGAKDRGANLPGLIVYPGFAELEAAALVNFLGLLAAGKGLLILDPSLQWSEPEREKIIAAERAASWPVDG